MMCGCVACVRDVSVGIWDREQEGIHEQRNKLSFFISSVLQIKRLRGKPPGCGWLFSVS